MSPLFYAVGASEGLDSDRKWIDMRYDPVLAKDERLVVTTMLLNQFTIRLFKANT